VGRRGKSISNDLERHGTRRVALSQYYGVDWLAMCLTFTAIYLLGGKRRAGFVVMMTGNLLWCAIGTWAHSYAMIIANLGFLAMNIRGYVKWADPHASAASPIH
jgi:hypothetical protein